MSGEGPSASRGGGRIVISSLTGEPIPWDDGESGADGADRDRAGRSAAAEPPLIPDRLREDAPEPGADESNDARLAGDVPPHWGR